MSEKKHQEAARDAESARRKLSSCEARLEHAARDGHRAESELAAARGELQAARDKASEEYNLRMRAEAGLEVLRGQSAALGKSQASAMEKSAAAARADSLDQKVRGLEADLAASQAKTSALRAAAEAAETTTRTLSTSLAQHEGTAVQATARIEALQKDLAAQAAQAQLYRQEGRKARASILDAVTQMREVVNVVRAEASTQGTLLATPEKAGQPGDSIPSVSSSSSSLLEALAIADLTAALSALRDSLAFLRQSQRQRAQQDAALRQLEKDKVCRATC